MSDQDHAHRLASGMFRRLRDVILVAERIEDFTFGPAEPGQSRPALRDGDAPALARDLLLRALRSAGDSMNWRILEATEAEQEGCPIDGLAELCGLPRLAVTERANELVQAGLCMRAIDADRIVITDAGLALLAFVSATTTELARRAEESGGKERTNGERGLPVL